MLTAPDGKDEEGKPIKLEPPVIAKPGGGFRLNPNRRGISRAAIGGEVVDNLLPPGHPLGMTTKNKEQKDNLKAGKDFDKIKQAYITQEEGTRDLTQAELDLLEEHADLIAENKDLFDEIIEEDDEKRIIENAQKGAKGEISTERDEDSSPDDIDKRNKENLSKVEALQRKLAEEQTKLLPTSIHTTNILISLLCSGFVLVLSLFTPAISIDNPLSPTFPTL